MQGRKSPVDFDLGPGNVRHGDVLFESFLVSFDFFYFIIIIFFFCAFTHFYFSLSMVR